eukprot:Em0015g948a
MICHPKPLRDKTSPPCGRPATHSPQKIIAGIRAIAPPTESLLDDHFTGQLRNPGATAVSHMPEDFTPASGAPIGVKCPCCFHDTPITAPQLKAAPLLIQTLLRDIVLQCQTCRKDIKACEPARLPRQQVIKRRCIHMLNIREVVSQEESSALLRRELDYLSTSDWQILLQEAGIVSAIGPGEALAIYAGLGMPWSKLRVLRSPKYMDDFLTSNRWLKASGVSISCEEKMRQIARGLLGENLQGEVAPPSFCLSSGGEEIRGAPLVFMPDLNQKVIQMLDDDHSVGRLTWRNGIIPQTEVWVKLGGDKEGNTTKMNFQIINVPTPNTIHNTCVFCCFAATDSVTNLHSATGPLQRPGKYPCLICEIPQKQMAVPPSLRKCYPLRSLEHIQESHKQFMAAGGKRKKVKNYMNYVTEPIFDIPIDQVCLPGLHITQGIFVKIFDLLEDACHQLDLQLAYTYTEESSSSSSFTKYAEELHKLQHMGWTALEITEFLMQQAEDMRQSVEKMVDNSVIKKALCMTYMLTIITKHKQQEEMANTTKVTKSLLLMMVHLCKVWDNAFGVHRQQYFGGTFVGNHIHKALKPSNIECLSSCMVEVAKAKCPALVASATREQTGFRRSLSLLRQCHQIYDQNYIDESQCNELVKMHMLEEHTVPWARKTHVGFGLLGEQEAESIHARFNGLQRTYHSVPDKVQQLVLMVKEHLLSVAPQNVAAIPPLTKRIKQ